MATCQDCETPVVWLKKPDGGWLPPVEPVFDFAYNDHFTASVDGTAQPVPQVYKRHECLSWEEKQLKMLEREREKQALIEADRARRAEAERVQRELEEAREAQDEAERKLRKELDRAERQRRARQAARRREKDAEQQLEDYRRRFPKRLLPYPCRDCDAQVNEPCRTTYWRTKVHPRLWWQSSGHNARYADAPPDDRSRLVLPRRWDDDDVWPPADNDPGRYDMVRWLRRHYIDVFEPEKRWLTDDEQRTLTDWLLEFGSLFEEVGNGPGDDPGGVAEGGADAGAEGAGRGDAERARGEEGAGDRVDPGGQGGESSSDREQDDRREGEGSWLTCPRTGAPPWPNG